MKTQVTMTQMKQLLMSQISRKSLIERILIQQGERAELQKYIL